MLQEIQEHERIIDMMEEAKKPVRSFATPFRFHSDPYAEYNIKASYEELVNTKEQRDRVTSIVAQIRVQALQNYDPAVMEEIHRKNAEELEEALKAEEQRNEAGRNGNS